MSSKQRNEQQRASTFSSIGGNEGEAAATTALVPFNNFLDFFNGAGFDDEGTLAKICDRDAVEKLPDPSTVKASIYKPQKYYRKDDQGNVSFYVAWTLFVVCADGTVKCWMKAKDILHGIGYETEHVNKHLKKYIYDEREYTVWDNIRQYILSPLFSGQFMTTKERGNLSSPPSFNFQCYEGKEVKKLSEKMNDVITKHNEETRQVENTSIVRLGVDEANQVRHGTLFLTENGVLQLHQLSPKCKTFRNTVSNFLLYIREKLTVGTVVVSQTYLNELKARAEKGDRLAVAVTDSATAERDRELAELRDQLAAARKEKETRASEYEDRLKEKDAELEEATIKLKELNAELEEKTATLNETVTELKSKTVELDKLSLELDETTDDLYEAEKKLNTVSAELEVAQKHLEELSDVEVRLRRTQVELDTVTEELKTVSEELTRKRDTLEKTSKAISVVSRVYSSPRNTWFCDGMTRIAQEACAFFVAFGSLKVGGKQRPGICIFRRQRRSLVQTGNGLFAKSTGSNQHRSIRRDYRTLGKLYRRGLATIDEFSLPTYYAPEDFIYPACDTRLNRMSDRFLLLNTVNAINFVNMILEGCCIGNSSNNDTIDSNEKVMNLDDSSSSESDDNSVRLEEDGDDDDAAAERDELLAALKRRRRQRKQLMKKRGSVMLKVRPNGEGIDVSEYDDEENERQARSTRRLIRKILREDSSLRVALSLKRYRYPVELPGDYSSSRQRRCPRNVGYASSVTEFYCSDPTVSGPEILSAVRMLWQRLNEALRDQAHATVEEKVSHLLKLFEEESSQT